VNASAPVTVSVDGRVDGTQNSLVRDDDGGSAFPLPPMATVSPAYPPLRQRTIKVSVESADDDCVLSYLRLNVR
jgi:hypothetical protein